MTFIEKIRVVKTMPELDALRIECFQEMQKVGQFGYKEIQEEFIKAKNRLLRVPRKERTW